MVFRSVKVTRASRISAPGTRKVGGAGVQRPEPPGMGPGTHLYHPGLSRLMFEHPRGRVASSIETDCRKDPIRHPC